MKPRFALSLLVAASFAIAGPVLAKPAESRMSLCATQWQTMKKAETAKGSYSDFSKSCLRDGPAAAPAAPVAATSPAVAAPAKKPSALGGLLGANAAPKAAPAPASASKVKTVTTSAAGATAQCKDGSFSQAKSHTGACSRHGGVAKWL